MFSYYFKLGVRSLRRNPALTALMVLTLAIGVAASVSTLTILHVMAADPIPQKSDRLLVPIVDNGPLTGYVPGKQRYPVNQLSYTDASNFLNSKQGERRTVMYGVELSVEPPRKDLGAFTARGMAPTRDFFAMFDVPFVHGQPWSEADEARAADVVVLSSEVAAKLFGDADPVGQRINIAGAPFTIVGVTAHWAPLPRYYHLVGGTRFGEGEQLFIPFATALRHQIQHSGNMNCQSRPEPGYEGLHQRSECTWLQFWFETRSAGDRAELQSWLDNYANDQRKLGRLKRAAPNELYDVREWMEHLNVVGNDSKLSAWLAFGFLVLCLVNTIGLLLAKFSVRASEVGVRRALGASRREIFHQFLIETAVVGLAGGALGLLLAFGALGLISMQGKEVAAVAHLDLSMLAFTFVMSVVAAMVAGLLPTWRACNVTPALQLKSQ